MMARELWIESRCHAALRERHVAAAAEDDVLVKTLYTAVSRGTERLIFNGQVPASEHERMRAPHQQGDFTFPLKYGYACVGTVQASPAAARADLSGKRVFGLFPHQDAFFANPATLTPLPSSLPSARAALAANMETALNGCWDASILPGERVAVVGCGVLGALLVNLCSRIAGVQVEAIEPDRLKHKALLSMGASSACTSAADTSAGSGGFDLVFHTSASESGLQTAFKLAGHEARIVEMSWYGNRSVSVGLGGSAHPFRLKLLSSQVGTIPPIQAPRWTYGRRLTKALELLHDDRLDVLLSAECSLDQLPDVMSRLFADSSSDSALFAQIVHYKY